MTIAEKPKNEIERLESLVRYDILDTNPEREYDDIAKIAAYAFDMPVAMISFIDETRKWYKAAVGVESQDMPREIAVCSHTMVSDQEVMIIEDARKDARFVDSPATKGNTPTIFYAGVKLVNSDGFVLGTICVVDHKPNKIKEGQAEILIALANQVIKLLEHRKNNILLSQIKQHMSTQYAELEKFSYVVAHDINSPINSMISLAQLLEENLETDPETQAYAVQMIQSGHKLSDYVKNILAYYKSDKVSSVDKESVSLQQAVNKVLELIDPESKCQFHLSCEDTAIHVRMAALDQVLINLVKNAIRHCDKEQSVITIDFSESDSHYQFAIQDNGPGIEPEDQKRIFDFMVTLDQRTTGGSGIGLAIVKKIVEKEGGTISVNSSIGEGSSFQFTLKK